MSYNKFLMLGAGVLLSAIASSNVSAAVNCSISYYCYRSMTPGPAPAGNDVLVRRTTAANNRVTSAARRAQPQRPGVARAPQQQRVQLTPQQRQAEARRREQVQQRELAQRRQRAAQQAQQRLAQQRQRAQQLAQRRQQNAQRPAAQRPAQPAAANRAQPNANANATRQQQLIAAQRRAHQAEQQRLAQQRLAQQRRSQAQAAAAAARTQPVANRATPTPPRPSVITSGNQSCSVISKKIAELSRQAVLRSKEKKYDQSQRLFKAVEQLKAEGKKSSCPGIV